MKVNKVQYRNAATEVKEVSICNAKLLTDDPSVKKCLELEVDSNVS